MARITRSIRPVRQQHIDQYWLLNLHSHKNSVHLRTPGRCLQAECPRMQAGYLHACTECMALFVKFMSEGLKLVSGASADGTADNAMHSGTHMRALKLREFLQS